MCVCGCKEIVFEFEFEFITGQKLITAPVEGMIRDLSEVHDDINKTMKKIRQQGDEVDKKIDHLYDALVQKLLEQKEQLKQRAHDAVSQKEKALANGATGKSEICTSRNP